MPGPKALTDRSVADLWKEVKNPERWWDDLQDELTRTIKDLLENALEGELLEQLHARWYQRNPDRVDQRNGFYMRSLQTRLGVIQDLRVPRSRNGIYQSELLPRYQRAEASVEQLVKDAFLAGVSTRRVGEVLKPVLGTATSPATVSQIAKHLDADVAAFHKRALTDDIVYLFLDGVYAKVKGTDRAHRKPLLVAYGITTTGERRLISYRLGFSESEPEWEAFLNDLYKRGLEGKNLRLIVTDGGSGLHAALQTVYPYVPRQRCWVHKMRNVRSKLPARQRDACVQQLRTVYLAATQEAARERYKIWVQRWEETAPKAVECVRKDIDELLSFLKEPAAVWRSVRTTNAIERLFREVRRRVRPMTCFNNNDSCERITYSVFSYQNTKWEGRPLQHFTQNT